jgi:DME family drug/metabolite transporter
LTANRHPLRGYLYIATATFLWGCGANLGRAAFTGKLAHFGSFAAINPVILSQTRITFVFLILLPVLWFSRGGAQLRLPKGDLIHFFVIGVLGVAASNYFYYLAIQRTNVAIAIIVQYTAPIWVLLYMVARKLQTLSWQRIVSVLFAVTGTTLLVEIGTSNFHLDVIGVTSALMAAFAFSFYSISSHSKLKRYDHWIVMLYTTLGAALFWIVFNPPWKIMAAHYSAVQWQYMLVFSIVSALGPYSLYFAGLRHLEPTRAIIVSCLEPVFSILIAVIVLAETMRPLQVLGIVSVLFAIVVIQIPDRKESTILVEPIE